MSHINESFHTKICAYSKRALYILHRDLFVFFLKYHEYLEKSPEYSVSKGAASSCCSGTHVLYINASCHVKMTFTHKHTHTHTHTYTHTHTRTHTHTLTLTHMCHTHTHTHVHAYTPYTRGAQPATAAMEHTCRT